MSHVRDSAEDRRTARRSTPDSQGFGTEARLGPGSDVRIVNLSATGALVEGRGRLRPGASMELCLSASGVRRPARCAVLRCQVSSLDPATGVRYRAALRFIPRIDLARPVGSAAEYSLPGIRTGGAAQLGQDYPSR
jgi:hypothetical protein